MNSKSVFNATVCLLGAIILLIHIVNILLKKNRRKDENTLLSFFIFTMCHFLIYFAFVVIKEVYTSDAYIMGFYTAFYIMNNIEVLLFYLYLSRYANIPSNTRKTVDIINLILFFILVITDIINIFTRIMNVTSMSIVSTAMPMIIKRVTLMRLECIVVNT